MIFLFYRKNQKNVLQKETKDWAFEAYLLTEKTVLDSSDWIIENCARSYAWFAWFLIISIVFRGMSRPNSVKQLWPVQCH